MKKNSSLLVLLCCYLIWGFQPLYWHFLADTEPLFLLASRIIWAAVFSVILLAIQGKLGQLIDAFKNKRLFLRLLAASVFLLIDWGVFIIAVQTGHVFDSSIGYYTCPVVMIVFGVVLFKEKFYWYHGVALAFVLAGIIFLLTGGQSMSYIAVCLALAWAIYSAITKSLKVDSLVVTAVETLILAPIAIAFILIFRTGENGLSSLNISRSLLLLGSGVVTAVPIILFGSCIKKLKLVYMSFAQYLCPTFGIVCGFILSEKMTREKLISFCFIWAGLIVFTIAQTLTAKKRELTARPD